MWAAAGYVTLTPDRKPAGISHARDCDSHNQARTKTMIIDTVPFPVADTRELMAHPRELVARNSLYQEIPQNWEEWPTSVPDKSYSDSCWPDNYTAHPSTATAPYELVWTHCEPLSRPPYLDPMEFLENDADAEYQEAPYSREMPCHHACKPPLPVPTHEHDRYHEIASYGERLFNEAPAVAPYLMDENFSYPHVPIIAPSEMVDTVPIVDSTPVKISELDSYRGQELVVPLTPMTEERYETICKVVKKRDISARTVSDILALFPNQDQTVTPPQQSSCPVIIIRLGQSASSSGDNKRKKLTKASYVKRPLNSFMLYRRGQTQRAVANARACNVRVNHQIISSIIGSLWQTESRTVQESFAPIAAMEKELHRAQYPGYKYQPKKKKVMRERNTASSPVESSQG